MSLAAMPSMRGLPIRNRTYEILYSVVGKAAEQILVRYLSWRRTVVVTREVALADSYRVAGVCAVGIGDSPPWIQT